MADDREAGAPERLLTKKDVADLASISLSNVSERIRSGEMRTVRIGRSVRIRQGEYARWIESLDLPDPDGTAPC